ncbi:MAG TPA: RyR domain-containing protein [Planctomycetota bacterium]|nr:RyR domain-containing protein [Planctomycetota bacterium]
MTAPLPDNVRNDPATWPALSDADWVALHVPRFKAVRPLYVAYEEFLKPVLKQACRVLAPLAIVDARAKQIPSFAEKIIRKRADYTDPNEPLPPDPLVRITDLCGARVIAQTSDQVDKICQFIEKAFDIDWPNSADNNQRLKPCEFGYRSVHYIVMVNPEKLKAAGIEAEVPAELLGYEPELAGAPAASRPLKAEIQVRTLLEHAWADIGHDMTYKTEFKVPDRILRQFAQVAAVLEGADRDFGRLIASLADFRSNYGQYLDRKELKAEIARLRVVLASVGDVKLAVKIARLAIAIGEHETACEVLGPYRDQADAGVQQALGIALTEMHWDRPRSREYIEGRELLAEAVKHGERNAEALCALADAWAPTNTAEARKWYREAAAVDSTEPLTLCRYLEHEVDHSGSDAVIRLAEPMIRSAADHCRKQIEGRSNLPNAWACLAFFHLFLKKPYDALRAMAQVVRLCDSGSMDPAAAPPGAAQPRPCAAGRALLRARDALQHLRCIHEKLPGFDWLERALLLALAVRVGDDDAKAAVRRLASWQGGESHFGELGSVVILSGGCTREIQPVMDAFRPLLLGASEELSFTLLSGGTASGISGIAGDLARRSPELIRAFGYLPHLLPVGVRLDTEGFSKLVQSPGSDFTPLDPLQGWTDLVVAKADLRRVKVLAYAGGAISQAECCIALALGARVGWVEDKSLPKERLFDDPDWQDAKGLVRLPLDAMSLRAFLLVDELPCEKAEYEVAARLVHEDYVKTAQPRDSSLQPWGKLAPDLRVSNFHQVAYAVNILKSAGLSVRTLTDPSRPLLDIEAELGAEGIKRLAEMEHGRWNVERLLRGWHHAAVKDVPKKLSPYLVPWDKLTPEIKKYDLEAMRNLPKNLRAAGLEVFKP